MFDGTVAGESIIILIEKLKLPQVYHGLLVKEAKSVLLQLKTGRCLCVPVFISTPSGEKTSIKIYKNASADSG